MANENLKTVSINGVGMDVPECSGIKTVVANSLPATGEDGTVYCIPNGGASPQKYDEYIWVNGAFELLGGNSGEVVVKKCYGFAIDQTDENPETSVTYTDEAVGMTPFQMDLETGVPSYGSWADAFFMPKPCMLKFDGTVDYYLDPNDYTKKTDGSASDVENVDYEGNAMMEWPVIYVSRTMDGDTIFTKIASYQVDDTFECFSNHGMDGSIGKFYTPIYNGSLDANDRLRSLSGKTIMNNKEASEEMQYAQANGTGWNIELVSDRMVINDLLVLMGKNTNTQEVFGEGFTTGGSLTNIKPTGTLNDKGMFYGLSDTSTPVKVFGMENYWGQINRRIAGWTLNEHEHYIKMTYGQEDGSTVDGFNIDGTGYVATGVTSNLSGYIAKMNASKYGMLIEGNTTATATTHYCDTGYTNNNGVRFACVGGGSAHGSACGAFRSDLRYTASRRYWYIGASLSYKPSA